MTAPECHACSGRWPDPADRIADLGESVAYLNGDQFFPGWTVLVLRRHATELYQLEAGARARLVDEVSEVARTLATAFGARKVNYALFGNVLPHIHWHVVPRLVTDPAPLETVFSVPHEPVHLGATERVERIARIRSGLGR